MLTCCSVRQFSVMELTWPMGKESGMETYSPLSPLALTFLVVFTDTQKIETVAILRQISSQNSQLLKPAM